MKKLLEKYLPKEIIYRPKKGFSVPMHNWIKNDLKNLCLDKLSYDKVKNIPCLNNNSVQKLVNDFYNNK
jgi:asparagine synthase (glutamine-hydrolysing)